MLMEVKMNTYDREQLLDMLAYCFHIFKAKDDLDKAIEAEKERVYDKSMSGVYNFFYKYYQIGVIIFSVGLCLMTPGIDIISMILGVLFGYFIFFVLFGTLIMMVIASIYEHFFAEKKVTEADNGDEINGYRKKGEELLQDKLFLQYRSEIPSAYFNPNDLYFLYCYLEDFRADNFKEAANLLAEEKHRDKIEYNQQLMKRSLLAIESNLQYQSVIQTTQLLETKVISAKLDVR